MGQGMTYGQAMDLVVVQEIPCCFYWISMQKCKKSANPYGISLSGCMGRCRNLQKKQKIRSFHQPIGKCFSRYVFPCCLFCVFCRPIPGQLAQTVLYFYLAGHQDVGPR